MKITNNYTNICHLSECVEIHKKAHSKFILDAMNEDNYIILENL